MQREHAVADAGTIGRARRGDREALATIWRIYQPQLLRFLRARRSPAPEDVTSQVWLDVGRVIERFDGDGRALQRWLFTIARRRSVDEERRLTRRREVPVGDGDERGLDPRTLHLDPTDDIGSLDRALALVRRLPPDMADAVMLRVVHELSVSEVAEVMERSDGNVRVLVHRGLARLNAMLTGDEVESWTGVTP